MPYHNLDEHTHTFPSGYVKIANCKITIINGKIHYQWPFSIAMLVYERVGAKISHGS
jgi:hypothetical protein